MEAKDCSACSMPNCRSRNLSATEHCLLKTASQEVTKDKESALKFLKEAEIVDENNQLAEPYREDSAGDDLKAVVDKEANEIWKEINSGHYYSVVESFNQFYGICMQIAESAANWQKQQMVAKAIDGVVTFDYYDSGNKTYGCVAHDSFCLEDFGLKDRDEVKIIVIKEG